jgi:hypothetical protein
MKSNLALEAKIVIFHKIQEEFKIRRMNHGNKST